MILKVFTLLSVLFNFVKWIDVIFMPIVFTIKIANITSDYILFVDIGDIVLFA